jgi:hypothetical protein
MGGVLVGGFRETCGTPLRPTMPAKKSPSPGLYANIAAKRRRIKAGAKERMARPGEAGRPTAAAFKAAEKTARKRKG